jgi:flagellar capping protein FliD
VNGFAATVSSYIKSYGDVDGAIHNVQTRVQTTIDNYGTRIAKMESDLALRQDSLTKQFTAADQAISQLNSQSSALNSLGSQYRLF